MIYLPYGHRLILIKVSFNFTSKKLINFFFTLELGGKLSCCDLHILSLAVFEMVNDFIR